jgi:hypothetical protein
VAGITQKVQLFNDALKRVMLHVEEAGPLKSGSTSIAARIVRQLTLGGGTDPVRIAAEAIRLLENGETETRTKNL